MSKKKTAKAVKKNGAKAPKRSVGRPTKYNPKFINSVEKYLKKNQDGWDKLITQQKEEEKSIGKSKKKTKFGYTIYSMRRKVLLPTIDGFAKYINVSLRVLADWEKKYPDFLRALEKIRTEQKERLINNSLSGEYNPTIAKLILSSNHGMVERKELSGDLKIGITFDNAFNTT